MGQLAHYDVTGTVHLADPKAVETAVLDLLTHRFTAVDVALISRAFQTFSALFAGLLPGFKGCDTWYHDAQHSLDATLAFARLLDGYEQSVPPAEQLGTERALKRQRLAGLGHVHAGHLLHDLEFRQSLLHGEIRILAHDHRQRETLRHADDVFVVARVAPPSPPFLLGPRVGHAVAASSPSSSTPRAVPSSPAAAS